MSKCSTKSIQVHVLYMYCKMTRNYIEVHIVTEATPRSVTTAARSRRCRLIVKKPHWTKQQLATRAAALSWKHKHGRFRRLMSTGWQDSLDHAATVRVSPAPHSSVTSTHWSGRVEARRCSLSCTYMHVHVRVHVEHQWMYCAINNYYRFYRLFVNSFQVMMDWAIRVLRVDVWIHVPKLYYMYQQWRHSRSDPDSDASARPNWVAAACRSNVGPIF